MSNLLLIDGSVLIKVWAIGYLGFDIGGLIHLIPVIAILALVLKYFFDKAIMQEKKLNYTDFKMY